MPRPRPYDLDELLAYWGSGRYGSAAEVMEAAAIPAEHLRSVQKALNRYFGPRPKRPEPRRDPMRRRVIQWMVEHGHDRRRCGDCSRVTTLPMYLREVAQDDALGSLIFVCRHCRRGGDF